MIVRRAGGDDATMSVLLRWVGATVVGGVVGVASARSAMPSEAPDFYQTYRTRYAYAPSELAEFLAEDLGVAGRANSPRGALIL